MDTDLLRQYNAVKDGAGLLDLSGRGKILVSGPDREPFLHAMISNDVQHLETGQGCYATFLTPRGKMVTDLYVYKLPQFLLADLPESRAPETVEVFQKFIVMDDVTVEDVSPEWSHLALQGPQSGQILTDVFQMDRLPGEELEVARVQWQKLPGWLIRKGDLDPVGFELILPAEVQQQVRDSILEQSQGGAVAEVSDEVHNILRLEKAIPWFGQDMDQDNYPMEARLEKAISFTKGCYVGQEVVAKATYVGGVSRLLACLKFEPPRIPEKGTRILDSEGREIGYVTSSAFSPALNGPIGLGLLKKAVSRPGSDLHLVFPDEQKAAVEVVESFES